MERRRRNRVLPLPWVSQHPSNADISYSFHYTSVGLGLRGSPSINSELPAECGCSGSLRHPVVDVATRGRRMGREQMTYENKSENALMFMMY